jgi:hypothetical protein
LRLPGIQLSGSFGNLNGKSQLSAQITGGWLNGPQNLQPVSSDPIWKSTDTDRLLARDTSDQFLIPALTATAGLTTAISAELVRALRHHRALDWRRIYKDSIVATASGFAIGTLGAPGITNHFMAQGVVDAALRYISKLVFMGQSARGEAGSLQTDLIIGALRGALESRLPPEVSEFLPCQTQNLPADICNGLYAITAKSILQGSEETASQLLARRLLPEAPRLSTDLLSAFFRGAAFGAVEQTLYEITLGVPQWMSPESRYRIGQIFRESGLEEGSVECLEKNTFLYGGLWSLFTREQDLSFNMGSTTMIDREFYFLDDGKQSTTSVLAHEVGGHCTQWLNLGLVGFLTQYLSEFAGRNTSPEDQAIPSFDAGRILCDGNSFECEATGFQLTVVDLITN